MRKFVEGLAARLKTKPPAGYTKSADACRRFLDQHAPKRPDGRDTEGNATRDPTAAQRVFAEKAAQGRGIAIPEETKASTRSPSVWTGANRDKAGRQPTKGQPPLRERR